MIKKPVGGLPAKALLFMAIIGSAMMVLFVLLQGGPGWLAGAASVPVEPLEQVTIATNMAYAGSCPIVAAQEKGYFKGEGVSVVIQPQSSGKAAWESVLQGQANLGTVADLPIMFAALDKQPVSVIATIFKTEKDHGIVGRRDRGITTLESLKGKRIGVTLNTSGHFTLNALLNRGQLSPDEVSVRNYKPEELATALEHGDVDAAATWEPFLGSSMRELGGNGVVFYGQDVYTSIYNVAGVQDYVVSHPETIKHVLRALINGARYCSESPDEASVQFAASTKSDAAKLKASWASYRFNVVLDQGLILALEDEARWAIANKLTKATQVPNYLNHIYLGGLEAVMPAAVTIIH